ncbi:cytosolic endo-beta-N-acetylglucosaminidase [Ixodes scapularis]
MGDDRSAVSTGVGEECLPLKTLEELLNFDAKKLAPSSAIEPLRDRVRTPDGPRTLLCHDMMGGYLEDRFLQGSSKSDSYRFHHWHLIDTFVYFSHYLVTIPPVAWINAAHKHGVKVLASYGTRPSSTVLKWQRTTSQKLACRAIEYCRPKGTFITEWESGTKILEEVRNSQATQKVATQLASVAAAHGFDGWLINIESALGEDCGPFLEVLLSAITAETHRAVPGSEVLWYDSILASGKLDWQNELNELNGRFFDRCDGIFLNYGWTEEHLERSARFAGDRRWDVYVGVDVWARKTKYAGGYDTYKAVAAARKHGLSAAIFAPGWVFEMEDRALFTENQYRSVQAPLEP